MMSFCLAGHDLTSGGSAWLAWAERVRDIWFRCSESERSGPMDGEAMSDDRITCLAYINVTVPRDSWDCPGCPMITQGAYTNVTGTVGTVPNVPK